MAAPGRGVVPAWDRFSAAARKTAPGRTAKILPGAWLPCGSQAAGPAPRTKVTVWDWPDWSVQLMLILSPGW
jgi:hypothetical protein